MLRNTSMAMRCTGDNIKELLAFAADCPEILDDKPKIGTSPYARLVDVCGFMCGMRRGDWLIKTDHDVIICRPIDD